MLHVVRSCTFEGVRIHGGLLLEEIETVVWHSVVCKSGIAAIVLDASPGQVVCSVSEHEGLLGPRFNLFWGNNAQYYGYGSYSSELLTISLISQSPMPQVNDSILVSQCVEVPLGSYIKNLKVYGVLPELDCSSCIAYLDEQNQLTIMRPRHIKSNQHDVTTNDMFAFPQLDRQGTIVFSSLGQHETKVTSWAGFNSAHG